jgi:hypothetical protein
MSDSNVLHDTPAEFLQDIAQQPGRCTAQSVIPLDDGTYACACSCENWEVIAPSRQEGLQLARRHTGSI